MLKMRIFLKKKNCKNRLSVGDSASRIPVGLRRLGAEPPDSRVVTPAYYYNFVKIVSKR